MTLVSNVKAFTEVIGLKRRGNKKSTRRVSARRRKARSKGLPRVLKSTSKRTGKFGSVKADRKRRAMKPGLRLSKNRKKYYENRRNRSDVKFL